MTTQAPKKTRAKTATKAAAKAVEQPPPDDRGRWLSDLERSLLRFHQTAAQHRGRLRNAHRMPFVQCRTCDQVRRETVASKQRELEGGETSS